MSHEKDRLGNSLVSRRKFMTATAEAVGGVIFANDLLAAGAESPSASPTADITRLSEHVFVFHGPINIGIIRDGERALLIDIGDGRVVQSLPEIGIQSVAQIVFTHHHRDQACGAGPLAASGVKIGVPEAERELFADPASYWNKDGNIFPSCSPTTPAGPARCRSARASIRPLACDTSAPRGCWSPRQARRW